MPLGDVATPEIGALDAIVTDSTNEVTNDADVAGQFRSTHEDLQLSETNRTHAVAEVLLDASQRSGGSMTSEVDQPFGYSGAGHRRNSLDGGGSKSAESTKSSRSFGDSTVASPPLFALPSYESSRIEIEEARRLSVSSMAEDSLRTSPTAALLPAPAHQRR